MVFADLPELSAASRRNMARAMFSGFYERGYTAQQSLNALKEQGLGYRRQDFLKDFAQGKGTYEQATHVRYVRETGIPSESILQSQYHGVPDRYSFVFKATGTNTETGEPMTQHFYMHRENLSTRAAMEQDAFGWLSGQSDKYGIEIEEVTLEEGYINPIWG